MIFAEKILGVFCSMLLIPLLLPVSQLNNPQRLMTLMKAESKELPERLIVGYANWGQCDETLITAVKEGVNVLIWFSVNLSRNKQTQNPEVTGGPDMDCVAKIVKSISDMDLDVIHLISIGGWNSPHPDTSYSAEEWYAAFDYWNRQVAARPNLGFYGFDGFDWDIEGNDNPDSQFNTFTVECLDLMGKLSQIAKSRGQYIVSVAPAESYLDPRENGFDRSLLHTYPEWNHLQPPFAYHGKNCYAYLLSKYGNTSDETQKKIVDTFDFVTVQLYEGYSHADFYIYLQRVSPKNYFSDLMKLFLEGWSINFSSDPAINWPTQTVQFSASKIVIGLANGWAGAGKFLLVYPEDVHEAYDFMKAQGIEPRGFAFWNIKDEGQISSQKPGIPVYMASGLNKFLHIRN